MLFSLSFFALIPSLQADQRNLHPRKASTVPAENQTTVTIQVSAFKKSYEAERDVARLKSHGLDAKNRKESVPGNGVWYRVYVGRFKKRSEARAVADSLKAQGIISWAWIKPDMSPHEKAKAKTQAAVASKASPAKAPKPDPKPPKSAAALPQQIIKKEASAKRRLAPLVKPVSPTTARNPSMSQQAHQDGGASDQKAPAVREVAAKERTKPLLPGTFNFSSQTTFRAFERDTGEGQDTLVLPLYEYMQLDYADTEQGGWSVHAYGWVRSDLADSAYFEEPSDGELLYGYLEYSKPYSDLHLTLGRKHIFAGVTNETVDGLQFAAGLGGMLTATVFGGATAASDETSADITYGGRIAFHPKPAYELAISYQNTDLDGDPDQRTGVDLSINAGDWVTVQGLSSFSPDSEDWREHNYSAALRYKDITLEPVYQYFSYQDYFGNSTEENSLFHFLQDTEEQVTIAGADVQYQGVLPLRLTGRYNQYTYNLRQEQAAYYAALIGVDLPEGSQLGGEAGRMDGETDDNIYTLYRVYFYWHNPFKLRRSAFISGDAIFQDYDAPVFGRDNATNYSLSGGIRFFHDALEVKLTGAYSQDPYFDENVEGLLTFQINY
jgi:hypothetical protein